MFSLIAFLSIATLALATDCTLPANFPSVLRVGQVYPIEQISLSSPDGSLNTIISGNLVVLSPCSLQLKNLVLSGAPLTAGIQLYGEQGTSFGFPINAQVLSGDYNEVDGPVFTFYGKSIFQVPGAGGVSWSDFDSIRIYAVPSQWVIAQIKFPTVVIPNNVSTTVAPAPTSAPVPTSTVSSMQSVSSKASAPATRTPIVPTAKPNVNSGAFVEMKMLAACLAVVIACLL